jgi:hypothetical protein
VALTDHKFPSDRSKNAAGRVVVWLLLMLAAVAGIGFPIYRALSQSSTTNSPAPAQTDPEIADQETGVVSDGLNSDNMEIATRLVAHTNGTISIWFECQTNCIYRIDYADTKAATLAEMIWKLAADGLGCASNGWTEWVDAGETNRPAPRAVNER